MFEIMKNDPIENVDLGKKFCIKHFKFCGFFKHNENIFFK